MSECVIAQSRKIRLVAGAVATIAAAATLFLVLKNGVQFSPLIILLLPGVLVGTWLYQMTSSIGPADGVAIAVNAAFYFTVTRWTLRFWYKRQAVNNRTS